MIGELKKMDPAPMFLMLSKTKQPVSSVKLVALGDASFNLIDESPSGQAGYVSGLLFSTAE